MLNLFEIHINTFGIYSFVFDNNSKKGYIDVNEHKIQSNMTHG